MNQSMAALELEAMLLVRHLTLAGNRAEGTTTQSGPLERSAYTILSCLTCGGSMTLAQLSDTIGLETSTLHRQTAAMLKTGLIDRIADPDGGIARKFRVTAEGERRLAEACQENMSRMMQATADWAPADLDAFAAYLTRFNRALEARENRHWPRPWDGAGGADVTGGGEVTDVTDGADVADITDGAVIAATAGVAR